jgi:NCAIR mutase (PurE)-related protein
LFPTAPDDDLGLAQVGHTSVFKEGISEVIYGAVNLRLRYLNNHSLLQKSMFLLLEYASEHIKALRINIERRLSRNCKMNPIYVAPKTKLQGENFGWSAPARAIFRLLEAVVPAEIMGNVIERIYDVGVAGIHLYFEK